jgi:tol-pal system protein YbgF
VEIIQQGGNPLRTRWFALAAVSIFFGALGGAILAPQPAGAVSKEIIQLQQQVSQLLQGQQDLRTAIDTNGATLKTLVQQSLDSMNQLNGQMGALQKTVQDVQANTGSRMDAITQQSQGVADNLQDVQARMSKLSQQVSDIQNLLQSIDSKVSGSAPAGGMPQQNTPAGSVPNGTTPNAQGMNPGQGYAPPSGATSSQPSAPGPAPTAMPPISADTLYQNALRDFTSGKYDLSRQEFSDYIQDFPSNDLASNSQFYLGEIFYVQNDFKDAIAAYDEVLGNYPRSFKLAASLLKKGMAELELGQKAPGTRDLRDVVRRFPGSDESRRATAKLREMGISVTAAPSHSTGSR